MSKAGAAGIAIITALVVAFGTYYLSDQFFRSQLPLNKGEFPCPVCPPAATTAKSEIIIMDDHVVAWSPLDNFFANDPIDDANQTGYDPSHWHHGDAHWKGMMIQLGTYAGGNYPLHADEPYTVTAEDENGNRVSYTRTSGTQWINLVAFDPGNNKPDHSKQVPPMGSSHVPYLFSSCVTLSDCRYTRSLHFGFAPEKVITIWPGAGGYEVRFPANQGYARQVTFAFQRELTLEVDGAAVSGFGKLRKMTIEGGSHNRHFDNEDPPWPIP